MPQEWFSSYHLFVHSQKFKNTRRRCEKCSKLTIKTPERRQWHLYISHQYFTPFSSVSIVELKLVNVSWFISITEYAWRNNWQSIWHNVLVICQREHLKLYKNVFPPSPIFNFNKQDTSITITYFWKTKKINNIRRLRSYAI